MVVRTRMVTWEVTSNFGCILKIKLMGTANKVYVGCERKRRIQHGLRLLA